MTNETYNSSGKLDVSAATTRSANTEARIAVETRYDIKAFRAGKLLFEDVAFNRVVTVGLNILLDSTFKTGVTTPTWYIGLCGPSITDAAITSSTATLTSASNPFTSVDAGSPIIVRGAGSAGADLTTTILSYGSAGSVTLATNASTSVTGAAAIWGARAVDTMASHTPWVESTAYSEATRQTFTPGSIANGSVSNAASVATFTINANNTLIGGAFLVNNSTKGGTTGTLYGQAPFTSNGFRQLNSSDQIVVTCTLTVTSA